MVILGSYPVIWSVVEEGIVETSNAVSLMSVFSVLATKAERSALCSPYSP